MNNEKKSIWPKYIAPLTEEQKVINDDFMRYWHEVLPKKYSIVDDFNHEYPVKHAPKDFISTLEIGAGLGTHLIYEKLTPEQEANYVSNELRENMTEKIRERFPRVQTIVGDCQEHIDFKDGHFDRVLAIHVLEHLPNLPAALKEIYRIIHKEKGIFSIVIPCEGGIAYSLARKISAQRIFEKRYKQKYDVFIKREHINRPQEIVDEVKKYFDIQHTTFFPLHIPSITINLCIGITVTPKKKVNN